MQIHVIEDEKYISAVENGTKWLPIQDGWGEEDIIISNGERLTFYKIDTSITGNEKYARRQVDLNGTCSSIARLFDEMFGTYCECANAEETLRMYPNISRENLYDSMQKLIERVKKHGKINSKQEEILLCIYSGQKTKKQLVKEGVCTYQEIDGAYNCFISEAQLCYGFKNSWNMNYAEQFNAGQYDFYFSPKEFAELYKIDNALFRRIVMGMIDGLKVLPEGETKRIVSSIENDNYLCELTENSKKEIRDSIEKIVCYYLNAEMEYYSAVATELEKSQIIHIQDIRKYCAEKGLNYWKTTHCMKKLGIHIDHHSRNRSKRLKDYLE